MDLQVIIIFFIYADKCIKALNKVFVLLVCFCPKTLNEVPISLANKFCCMFFSFLLFRSLLLLLSTLNYCSICVSCFPLATHLMCMQDGSDVVKTELIPKQEGQGDIVVAECDSSTGLGIVDSERYTISLYLSPNLWFFGNVH